MCISHQELNTKAANYAHRTLNAGIVLIEHQCRGNNEIIDVAAFRSSIVVNIEVKVSRSDFLKDKSKPHRKPGACSMGHFRFYCCPAGVIKPEDLPEGWGLLEYHQKSDSIKCKSGPKSMMRCLQDPNSCSSKNKKILEPFFFESVNERAHTNLLFSAYRQLLLAQDQGLEVELDAIFRKPNGLTFRSELCGVMRNV